MATVSGSTLLAHYPVVAIYRLRPIRIHACAVGEIDAEIGAWPELLCPETAPRYATVSNLVRSVLIIFVLSPKLEGWDRERCIGRILRFITICV